MKLEYTIVYWGYTGLRVLVPRSLELVSGLELVSPATRKESPVVTIKAGDNRETLIGSIYSHYSYCSTLRGWGLT